MQRLPECSHVEGRCTRVCMPCYDGRFDAAACSPVVVVGGDDAVGVNPLADIVGDVANPYTLCTELPCVVSIDPPAAAAAAALSAITTAALSGPPIASCMAVVKQGTTTHAGTASAARVPVTTSAVM